MYEAPLARLAEFLTEVTAADELFDRLSFDGPEVPPGLGPVADALNAFLDKLWLKDFQIAAKQEMLEKVIEIRTNEVHEILDNVSSGFLIALDDETVLENYSRSCEAIFGQSALKGRKLSELMGLSPRDQFNFSAAYEQIFADFLPAELCVDQLPREFTREGRSYTIHGAPIFTAAGKVAKVFFTIDDTTELRKVEAENTLRQALLEIVRQRDGFRSFLHDTHTAIAKVRENPQQVAIRGLLHTLKGNVGCYGLHDLAHLVHALEDKATVAVSDLETVENALRRFLDNHRAVLHLDFPDAGLAAETIEVDRVVPVLQTLAAEPSAEARREFADEFLDRLHWVSAGALLSGFKGVVERVAERLEKDVAFEVGGAQVLVDPEHLGPVFSSLVHLVRNSLDHGIEQPWERQGKPPRARIAVLCEESDRERIIRAQDDGRGIDVDTLARAAIAAGKIDEARVAAMSREEKLRLIFLDDVSTATETTTLSGRGVGATAFLHSLDAVDGQVNVRSAPGVGTAFTVRIPRVKPGGRHG